MSLTKDSLEGILRKHYEGCSLDIPNLPRRAIAWNAYNRHNGYNTVSELRKALIEECPENAFYSTARYLDPHATAGPGRASETWKKKDRKATDLTFDLDFDHISGHEEISYREQMQSIATHTLRLIKLLEDQYGVKDYDISFSGRRGFHVKVYDEEYIYLDKASRKAIMNQITGQHLDKRCTLRGYQTNPTAGELSFRLMLPSTHSWGGLIRRTCDNIVHGIDSGLYDPIDFIKTNWPKKLTPKEIKILSERFCAPNIRRRLEATGDLRAFLGEKYATKARLENMYNMLATLAKEHHGVAIDESVTAEVNKLIRMHGSINTKHGYECRKIEKEELEDLEYLFYNCEQTFGYEKVSVDIPHAMTVHGNRTFTLEQGTVSLPMHEAVLALCQI